jgi:uncharacterized protein
MEKDFVVKTGKNRVPIGVKASENHQAKSLPTYCEKFQPELALRNWLSN